MMKIHLALASLFAIHASLIRGMEESPPIVFKYVNDYTFITNDGGSGARRDVSIWRPVDNEAGFYPLGDTASPLHQKPTTPSMTVSAAVDDALAAPISYQTVWTDRGSGATRDTKIVRLIPPAGYTCLGDVAVNEIHGTPAINQYRCVKSEYVEHGGQYYFIWNDRGSGAQSDVTFYGNGNTGSLVGRDANTFTAISSYTKPSGQPNLLRSIDSVEKSPILHSPDKALVVHQVAESELIWNDQGSGARDDVSIMEN